MPPTSLSSGDLEIRIRQSKEERGIPVELSVDAGRRFYSGHVDPSVLPWKPSPNQEVDGERLFNWLFADPRLRAGWDRTRSQYASCRIRIRLDAPDRYSQDDLDLYDIPWESLREVTSDGTVTEISASTATPFSRYITPRQDIDAPTRPDFLKMLVAIANPHDLADRGFDALDVEAELSFLQCAMAGQSVELVVVEQPCTLQSLEDGIRNGCHIVHFIGHGLHTEESGAVLVMADKEGSADFVDEQRIAEMVARLQGVADGEAIGALRLVYLASCQTARQSSADAFQGLAPRLLAAGVPAVLAMQDIIPVKTAQVFSRTFYRRLLSHGLVDLAVNEARASLLTERLPGATNPVLFATLSDGILWQVEEEGICRFAFSRRRIQICTLIIPTPVAVLTAMVSAIVLSLFAYIVFLVQLPEDIGPKPMRGDFKIAVSEFGLLGSDGVGAFPKGLDISNDVFRFLTDELKELQTDLEITVRAPEETGRVEGAHETEVADNAGQLARAINADLVIYGYVRVDDGDTSFEPQFLLSNILPVQAEEASGHHRFGSINVDGDLRRNPVTSQEFDEKLAEQSSGLTNFVIGLAYFGLNRYEEAASYFKQAERNPDWDADRGKSVLYLFMGSTSAHLGSLEEAEAYFTKALADDTEYARAQLGVAQMQYLQGRDGCAPGEVDVIKIEEALVGYDEALTAMHPPHAEIPVKAASFRARANLCLAIAGERDNWHEIADDLEAVIAEFEGASHERRERLKYYASEAWNDTAMTLLFEPDPDTGSQAWENCMLQKKCDEAINAFGKAETLSRQPNRQATFSIWQAQVRLWMNECDPAQQALDRAHKYRGEFLKDNPSGGDALPDDFWQTVDERWKAQCTNGLESST